MLDNQNITAIADRIYAPYFQVRQIIPEDKVFPKITDVNIVNKLNIPLQVYFIFSGPEHPDPDTTISPVEEGDFYHGGTAEQTLFLASGRGKIAANATVTLDNTRFSQFFDSMPLMQIKVMSQATQGVLGFWTYQDSDVNKDGLLTVTLDMSLIREPNAIGEPPQPSSEAPVPRDSPKLVVGFGALPVNNNYVVHQQYWRKGSQCYSLAPGESKTVIFASKSGITTASTDIQTISAAMSASVSGGYGGISAGLSIALSSTQRVESNQTVSQEKSIEVMDEIVNPHPDISVSIFAWELVDLYSICRDTNVLSSFEFTQAPAILRYFPPNAKPVAPSTF